MAGTGVGRAKYSGCRSPPGGHARSRRTPAAAILAVLALALPSLATLPAAAGPADPRFSAIDPVVVGTRVAIGGYHAVIRNVNNAPLSGKTVTLDFSGTSIRLDGARSSGITVDCAARTARTTSDGDGAINVAPGFGGFSNQAVIPLNANGVILGQTRARSTAFDGDGTTGLGDLAILSRAMLAGHEGAPCP